MIAVRIRGGRPRLPASEAAVVTVACFGAAVMTSGIQGIAPALPAIQSQFSLDAAQVALITSVYLLPSIFSAFGAGMLADRFGSRPVLAVALLVFGLGGVVLLVEHDLVGRSLAALLAVRFVQGAAFGAVLSLSVAIIGDVARSTRSAAAGQSRRVVTISVFESVLPIVGGLLVAAAWYAPFVSQLLALPCAVAAWFVLPGGGGRRTAPSVGTRAVLRAPALISVQLLGALRFVLKYAVLTYFPVLAVSVLGMRPVQVGLVLGVSAFLTATAAWFTQQLVGRWLASQLISVCLVAGMASLAALGAADLMPGGAVAVVAAGALFVFGAQDGVFGVAHNVLIADLAPPGARSSYVGLSGTVRNIGKFAAPMIFGAVTVVLTIQHSFLVLAAASLASVVPARRVVRVETAGVPTRTDG